MGQSQMPLRTSGLGQGSSAPAAGKLNEATSPERPGLALRLNGPKTSRSEINQSSSEIIKKKTKQEASPGGRH